MTESLPAKAFLLTYRTGRSRIWDRQRLGYLVRAAALADLLLRGRVIDVGGRVETTGTGGGTGDPVLDDTLAMIRRGEPRKWRYWVRKDRSRALRLVESQLGEAGVLVPEAGLRRGPRRVVGDESDLAAVRAAVEDALHAPGDAAAIAPADAVLTALLAATRVRHVVSRSDRRRHRGRLDALALRAAPVVQALDKVVTRQRRARIAMVTAGPHA